MSRRFNTVLVANRGEIACRVLRSAKHEGYRTVAVYSDADANAPHVAMADAAYRLGGSPVGESYLVPERILEAAKRAGADAIHPGYGFLSENADFARACTEAGIAFIGPPADAIAGMGDKGAAKRTMIEAKVPCVPGYEGDAQDDATLKAEAERIGYPVLLKAVAGGGGRGMRRVDSGDEFADALAQARTEAEGAFGSGVLIIEKLVEHARHVEVQVMADEHGNAVHFGERDCSVQRRHQKVVEEAPCPVMTPELRAAMGDAAVKAALACGYVNAGTVEFLLDDDNNYYFLEMNTRLQVEHPVTELVTGYDLVAIQLAVAQGEPLPVAQDDISLTGHAIEVRLYAEDPANDFSPQTGTVHTWDIAVGEGVRIDHGLQSGSEITPFYDAMIAKFIAYGEDRDQARQRLIGALRNSAVLGVTTNKPYLISILNEPGFAAGEARTSFLEEAGLLAYETPAPTPHDMLMAAAAIIERDAGVVPTAMKGWRSTGISRVPVKLAHGEDISELAIDLIGDQYSMTTDDETISFSIESADGGILRVREGDHTDSVRYAIDGDDIFIDNHQSAFHFIDMTYAPPDSGVDGADGVVKAPMVGQVVEVQVAPGDDVEEGQPLAVLEAMKMVNHVVAPCAGTIASVNIAVGDHVDAGRVIMIIQLAEE